MCNRNLDDDEQRARGPVRPPWVAPDIWDCYIRRYQQLMACPNVRIPLRFARENHKLLVDGMCKLQEVRESKAAPAEPPALLIPAPAPSPAAGVRVDPQEEVKSQLASIDRRLADIGTQLNNMMELHSGFFEMFLRQETRDIERNNLLNNIDENVNDLNIDPPGEEGENRD